MQTRYGRNYSSTERMRRIEKFLKLFIPPIITAPLRNRRKRCEEQRCDHVPDRQFYDGVFSPWLGYGAFGPLFEEIGKFSPGVFRGDTALLPKRILEKESARRKCEAADKRLRLFDVFGGMPEVPLVLPIGQAIVFKLQATDRKEQP